MTCSRARGTIFELPTPAVTGCTTCNQATGAATSTCSTTAACSFAIVPSKPLPTACECPPGNAASTPAATAAANSECDGITCTVPTADCVCASTIAAPTGTGCATILAGFPQSPGIELACVRKPRVACVSGCTPPDITPTAKGQCLDVEGTTSAADTPCRWAIVAKAPAVACKCSDVNAGATADPAVIGAVCPVGTLCTAPSNNCPCTDAATVPTDSTCPASPTGTALSCARAPPSGCGSCSVTGDVVGTGTGTTCPANTNCVRGTVASPCTGKRKRRNVPVNLPKD